MNHTDHMDDTPEPTESRRPRRRLATAGLAAGLVATGLVGGAVLGAPAITGAQSTTTTPESTEMPATETPAGEENGEEGARAPGGHLRDALQPLVDDGTLTADQAEAVIDALQEAHPAGGHGPGGPGGFRGPDIGALTDVLGLSAEEIRDALRGGSSLADLATAQGVEVQAVIDALVTSMDDRLAEAVAEGDLTQEQADTRRAEATERITAMVEGELPGPGLGSGPRGQGPGGRGPGFPGTDDNEGSTDDGS